MIKYKKFIKECENSGRFDNYQIAQIRLGFENGLTISQVKVYAKFELDWERMWEIRKGFENGLTMEQIKLFTKPEFNDKQMFKICEFIIDNKDMPINTLKFLIQLEGIINE